MSISIEGVLQNLDTGRCVGVEIYNNSTQYILTEPETYSYSGRVADPPPPIIDRGQKGVCVFIKTPYTTRGAVGVLTYKFGSTQISLQVSNPFDYNRYSIEFALYVPDYFIATNKNLYTQMYSELTESPSFTKTALGKGNTALNITKGKILVSATMSNERKAILKIDIRDA
ncbi:hydra actinoporin-like toxin 1 [Leucoraja erinacea]|uniref:hydra actinoporin-like toxin 1 n=1 Tax=Leucoraja erinaceus TaxID=7782 RepID=UPI002453F2EE|nr:hydra actinoporin-like toxin 1 [Leucoraja erinacea]XP_055512130.1 hydra actinoporin-like toxin 1 [Leucoraja erinacea]